MNMLSTRLLLIAIATCCWSAEPEAFHAETRGFGTVDAVLRVFGDSAERRSSTVFTAQDAEHARICASKRLADLTGFGDLAVVEGAGLAGTLVAADGIGAWLLGVRGREFHELYAPTVPDLTRTLAEAGAPALQPVVAHAHPRWLDCFDSAGPGVWVGGGGDNYELPRDFAWLKDHRFTMCTNYPTEGRLVGPGIVDFSTNDWHGAMAAKYGIPYRSLLFPGKPKWAWNRVPLPYVVAAPGTLSYPFPDGQADAIHASYEPNLATDPFTHDFRRRLAERQASDPNFIGGHGSTEVPSAGILELATVAGSPDIARRWREYLRSELRFDLATVSRLHTGDAGRYRTWDDVPVPLPEDFAGWDPARCVDLRGAWEVHADPADQGRKGSWFAGGKGDGWTTAAHNDPLIMMYRDRYNVANDAKVPFWMRKTVAVEGARLASAKYLHISRSAYHGNLPAACDAWLNGRPLKRLSGDGKDSGQCFELGDAVHAGDNLLVLETHGHPLPGYVFIGPEPLAAYPHLSPPLNRRWFDGVNFSAALRMRALEENLQAQRAGDPQRPLKLMALLSMLDLAWPLCERYGAYLHDTGGAAAFWAPMTGGRLSQAHGLPWSCEQGSPPNNVADMQKAITLYVMLGNDAMDLVFGVGHYSKKPEIAAWIDRNVELMHCVGQMRLPRPEIALLRSSRNTRLGFGEPWNWDVGRGELQAVGRNFTYVETTDLTPATLARYKVVMDAGTILMTEADVAGIEAYVRGGGTFIAQHLTGRHAPERADAWPISRLSGVTATNRGEGIGGPLRFGQEQTLWPQLRGKQLNGWGMALDWQGADVTGAPVDLVPGAADVEAVAEWVSPAPGQGKVAIASRRIGAGRVITLGSTFWREVRDAGGVYRPGAGSQEVLDELLTSLGVARDSWTGSRDVWGELWQSKNGVFDLYPVAQMNENADVPAVAVSLRRTTPVAQVTEISALGHPRVATTWKDGRLTLPATTYGRMQTRVFIAPRADRERAGLDWFRAQAGIWRALPAPTAAQRPAAIEPPEDQLPLVDGWKISPDTTSADLAQIAPGWIGEDMAAWKDVRLGAFGTLGVPDDATRRFRTTVALPSSWAARRVTLVFDAEYWFWGLFPQSRLWINGVPAALPQPLRAVPDPCFALDVTVPAGMGTLDFALEIDGSHQEKGKAQVKPSGVTGIFYLQADPRALRSDPLSGPWFAARDFNVLVPAADLPEYAYLQTSFGLPREWPTPRVFLEANGPLGCLVLNGQLIETPAWMRRLDITGLVRRDGTANVLRWSPQMPNYRRLHRDPVPVMRLAWQR